MLFELSVVAVQSSSSNAVINRHS